MGRVQVVIYDIIIYYEEVNYSQIGRIKSNIFFQASYNLFHEWAPLMSLTPQPFLFVLSFPSFSNRLVFLTLNHDYENACDNYILFVHLFQPCILLISMLRFVSCCATENRNSQGKLIHKIFY